MCGLPGCRHSGPPRRHGFFPRRGSSTGQVSSSSPARGESANKRGVLQSRPPTAAATATSRIPPGASHFRRRLDDPTTAVITPKRPHATPQGSPMTRDVQHDRADVLPRRSAYGDVERATTPHRVVAREAARVARVVEIARRRTDEDQGPEPVGCPARGEHPRPSRSPSGRRTRRRSGRARHRSPGRRRRSRRGMRW